METFTSVMETANHFNKILQISPWVNQEGDKFFIIYNNQNQPFLARTEVQFPTVSDIKSLPGENTFIKIKYSLIVYNIGLKVRPITSKNIIAQSVYFYVQDKNYQNKGWLQLIESNQRGQKLGSQILETTVQLMHQDNIKKIEGYATPLDANVQDTKKYIAYLEKLKKFYKNNHFNVPDNTLLPLITRKYNKNLQRFYKFRTINVPTHQTTFTAILPKNKIVHSAYAEDSQKELTKQKN